MSHKELVNQQQPFGHVEKHKMHPDGGKPASIDSKSLGSKTEVSNQGADQTQSFADKGAGAEARASAHKNDPFFWTGRPPKS